MFYYYFILLTPIKYQTISLTHFFAGEGVINYVAVTGQI